MESKTVENLTTDINKLSVDTVNYKKISYYKIDVELNRLIILTILKNYYNIKIDDKIYDKDSIITENDIKDKIIINDVEYMLNKEFHITLLYVGRKKNDNIEILENVLNNNVEIKIVQLGLSPNFITLKVIFITDNIPYFGNEIKHITVAINGKNKAKDSPSVFIDGNINELDVNVHGIIKRC